MKIFRCKNCETVLYFENTECLECQSEFGFVPEYNDLLPLEKLETNKWLILTENGKKSFKKCSNYLVENVCNWMLPFDDERSYCQACELNVTIPNLSDSNNKLYWSRLEAAKRRLIYSLNQFKLPIINRQENPEYGLGFRFLDNQNDQNKNILTGHHNGLITINIKEADHVYREKAKSDMNEKYRTLLGHFRHEIGHYYWSNLIEKSTYIDEFRSVFGDEQMDYGESLKQYYQKPGSIEWKNHFVSRYASSHPWEDWAETWAHYMHMFDTLETATAWGLDANILSASKKRTEESRRNILELQFDQIFDEWSNITLAINSMNRSMGLRDFYPFTLTNAVKEKLRFVGRVIREKSPTSSG